LRRFEGLKSKFIHNVLFVHTHEETQTIYECEAKLLPRKIINMNNSFPPDQLLKSKKSSLQGSNHKLSPTVYINEDSSTKVDHDYTRTLVHLAHLLSPSLTFTLKKWDLNFPHLSIYRPFVQDQMTYCNTLVKTIYFFND
jgi:hypothetical protein